MKAVSRITGLSADRLRVWESRHGVVRPDRSSNGRRFYSEQEVNRLKLMSELVGLGHSVGAISLLSDEELISLRSKQGGGVGFNYSGDDLIALMRAIGEFRLEDMRALLASVKHQLSPQEFAFRLVPQLMHDVGNKIENGSFSIAQEHAVSDLLRHQLRSIYDELQPLNGRKKFRVVFGSPEGHLHDFGVLLAAIRCRFQGFETHFLGANLPSASLVEAAVELKANALILGLSAVPVAEVKVEINSYLGEIHQALPKKISLWLGGPGIHLIQHKKMQRDVWLFSSLEEFDHKLRLMK